MLEVCLLGTGGMMPLPNRWLTSLMVKYNGSDLLIDCGEGTQIAMKCKGWSPKPIDVICFTHFHGDHIGGLPGMLLSMGNAERREPLTLIGPRGLERIVRSLCVIAADLPFELRFIELTEPFQILYLHGYRIEAFRVHHRVVCYGYNLVIERQGRFQVEQAKMLGLPVQYWNPLQKGREVEYNGVIYKPEQVMGAARKGLKVTYCTDTRPTQSILEHAGHADLMICEGMYGEKEKAVKAKEKKHMTFQEAARIAQAVRPGSMWLTHYSPSLVRPEQYLPEIREIYPYIEAARDGMSTTLRFEDGEEES